MAGGTTKIKHYLDGGVGVSDGPSVAGVEEWNVLGSGLDSTDAAELVLRLLVGDSVDGEPGKSQNAMVAKRRPNK